ncbi:MAG: M28 family peptidase [Planctomycetota bacterium]|nr:M28 family peptidase [Planctomycetota bacterium]
MHRLKPRLRFPAVLVILVALLAILPFARSAARGDSGDAVSIKLGPKGKKAVKSISKKEILKYIRFLASEKMQGREAGTEFGHAAGEFVAKEFKRLGLKPGGDGKSYFQTFQMGGGQVSRKSLQESNTVEVTHRRKPKKNDDDRTFRFRYDFIPLSISASMMVDPSPVAFVGFGLSEKEKGYDDYRGKRVKGKVVVAFDHVPMEGKEDGPFAGEEKKYSDYALKARTAMKKGAVGLIIVTDINNHSGNTGIPKKVLNGWPPPGDEVDAGLPVVFASQEAAAFILGDQNPRDLQKKIDSTGKPASKMISSRFVRLQIASLATVKGAGRNVIGIWPGSDKALAKEAIVIGAHYDHVGLGRSGSRGGRGQIHNGANDNASGTSGLLEVAEAFVESKVSIRRTIIFIAFDGEEKGLLGSRYYVTDPTVSMESTVAMLNMDMIGVNKEFEVFIGAGEENTTLKEIHVAANRIINLSIRYDGMEKFRNRSDQAPFLDAGVPALFFFTGEHPEYHTADDDIGLIDPALASGVARLCFITALELSNRDARP